MSKLFSLGKSDFVSSVLTAVFAAVIIALGGVVTQPGFNVFEVNWGEILGSSLNVAFITLIASLSKAFLSDKDDKFLGGL